MNFFNPYLVLATYPLLVYLLGDPTAYNWGLSHGSEPMPPSSALRVERNGRLAWIVRSVILISYILYGMRGLVVHSGTLVRSTLLGITFGTVLILLRYFVTPRRRGIPFENPDHSATRGPIAVWTIIILLGGCSEELWRALALYFLRHDGMSTVHAILLTAAVFALSELAGRPSLISSRRDELYFTVFVGICFAELLIKFHSLNMIVSANVAYHGLVFYLMRSRTKIDAAEQEAQSLGPTSG